MEHTAFHDMTFAALSKRADEINIGYTVADVLSNGDERGISVFLQHDVHSDMRGDDTTYRLDGKRIIGCALCDLDDPDALIEVLDRDASWAAFGRDWVERMEYVA